MSHSKGLHDVNRTNEVNINKLPKDYLILLFFIIIACFFTLIMTSCSSRKVAKSETKESQTNVESNSIKVQNTLTDNTKIVDSSTIDEIEICPVSDTLPMVINGITYKNAKIRRKKTKSNISIVKDVNVQHNVQKSGLKTVKTNKVVEAKQTESKQNCLYLWWLLLLIPIYFAYRKYKNLIF